MTRPSAASLPRLLLSGLVLVAVLAACTLAYRSMAGDVLQARQEFDRRNLFKVITPDLFDNDLVVDTFLLRAGDSQDNVVNIDLLGLRRDRFAYIARQDGQATAVLVPATVADGFNGYVDLLVAVNMMGRIEAVRVIEDIDSPVMYGVVSVVNSEWIRQFSGKAMSDMRRLSWSTVDPVPGEEERREQGVRCTGILRVHSYGAHAGGFRVKDLPGTVTVLGGGSFGTVMANIIAENGYRVKFWMRNEELVAQVNQTHENPHYLPGYRLHDNVVAYHDMEQAVSDSEVVFVAVPSAYFRTVVRNMLAWSRPDAILVSCTKGIEAGTFKLMSQVLQHECPEARI